MSTKPVFAVKPVNVAIAGTDFTFTPTVTDANNYTNGVSLDNKVEPARTYLERTVDKEQKAALVELMNTVPGLAVELHQTVHEASKGGIKITLKN
ncbi:putative phage tail assembly chaperone [Vibrio fluvialis]|nr:putative phage tail assembly chaperone [Vibrio fluvialis]MBY7939685.1 putative phage tail assembly chaperone [Vibrio fluvialis]MBY8167143.1 putative phage tail assembly chaperone [Vibrio fluvialis]